MRRFGALFYAGWLLVVAGCPGGPSQPAFACDSGFVQEPTTTEPDSIEPDLVAGLVLVTYKFIDDRVLVVVYQIRDIIDPDVTEPHPLFYIVTDKRHLSVTYIDKVGEGHCYDITRY